MGAHSRVTSKTPAFFDDQSSRREALDADYYNEQHDSRVDHININTEALEDQDKYDDFQLSQQFKFTSRLDKDEFGNPTIMD